MENQKVFQMPVSKVYPLLVNKAVRKGRTQEEVDTIITWLTGYSKEELEKLLEKNVSYQEFFDHANMNENCDKITGVVCKIHVETIEDPLMKKIRQLDKLVDELAKGKSMEKILRK